MTEPGPASNIPAASDIPALYEVVTAQPYPTVFATISGAHLYGFPSADSDVDLRGVHLLPVTEVIGLWHGPETIQHNDAREGVELDVVTHDLAKFCRLLLKPNGYVLEQLLSPLVVASTVVHQELISLVPHVVTRHHAQHYLGFAANQWRLFERTGRAKPALYTLRVLLTGIHLMHSGEVVADLRRLWRGHDLPYVPDLIEAKAVREQVDLAGVVGRPRLDRDVTRLRRALEEESAATSLSSRASAHDALHDLVVRTRLS